MQNLEIYSQAIIVAIQTFEKQTEKQRKRIKTFPQSFSHNRPFQIHSSLMVKILATQNYFKILRGVPKENLKGCSETT